MRLTTFESRLKRREAPESLPMTEREFAIAWALARASTKPEVINAKAVANDALEAWRVIKSCDN
jgi:hypothetical protein